MSATELELSDLRLLVQKQAHIIEDLSALCHELLDTVLQYQNVDEINDNLDQILNL